MNADTTQFNLAEQIGLVVPNVFETMLAFSASPDPAGGLMPDRDRVSGTIGIAGENVTGAVYVHLVEGLARQIVNAMLGNPASQPVGDSDLNDVVGELTNMVGGGLKSALCNADRPCAMSTPSIIRGAYAIELPQDLSAEIFYFKCNGLRLAVEIHLKLD